MENREGEFVRVLSIGGSKEYGPLRYAGRYVSLQSGVASMQHIPDDLAAF